MACCSNLYPGELGQGMIHVQPAVGIRFHPHIKKMPGMDDTREDSYWLSHSKGLLTLITPVIPQLEGWGNTKPATTEIPGT